jgi:holo-[acyl-carrier protein] synthase
MILGAGIDLVEVGRIERLLMRRGRSFLARVLSPEELALFTPVAPEDSPAFSLFVQRLAGRFAAKEAFLKALGTGLSQGVRWRDIAVLPQPDGAPVLRLCGKAAQVASSRRVAAMHVSISHCKPAAAAVVILESA